MAGTEALIISEVTLLILQWAKAKMIAKGMSAEEANEAMKKLAREVEKMDADSLPDPKELLGR